MGLLEMPGENSQSARIGRFTNLDQVTKNKNVIKNILEQAIEIERKGLKVDKKLSDSIEIPAELADAFSLNPSLASSFFNLTPGRQRSHIIFITGAKQSSTRVNRVEKCIPKILEGKGMLEKGDR